VVRTKAKRNALRALKKRRKKMHEAIVVGYRSGDVSYTDYLILHNECSHLYAREKAKLE
jgi:hypothetical protein